jgi:hypothetical protein
MATGTPQRITITLDVKPSKNSGTKGERGEKYGTVTPRRQTDVGKQVMHGDMIRFVPHKNLKNAKMVVRFVDGEESKTPKSPIKWNTIRTDAFYKVVHLHKVFWVWCVVKTKSQRFEGGGKVCNFNACPSPPR